MAKRKENPTVDAEGNMTLSGHLREMRNRLIVVLVILVAGIVVCFSFAEPLVTLLTDIGEKYNYNFVYIKPQELLMVYFTISLIGGVVISLPVGAYEIYAFSSPGLKAKEKTLMLLGMTFGMLFFCIGVFFAYKVMMPFMLRFLIGFSDTVDISASISIEEYVSFLLLIFVIFGVIFELPVISVILTALGIIKPDWLIKARKVMIVIIFFIAAIITPPDIISQIMVAIPIVLLYELSILLSKVIYKMKKTKPDDDGEDEDEDEDDD